MTGLNEGDGSSMRKRRRRRREGLRGGGSDSQNSLSCFPQLSIKALWRRENNTAFSIPSDGGGRGGQTEKERAGPNSSEPPGIRAREREIITQSRRESASQKHKRDEEKMTERRRREVETAGGGAPPGVC